MERKLPAAGPYLPKYKIFNVLDIPKENILSSDKFQEWLLKKYQGEAVEFWETYEIERAIFAFRIFCRFCPEVIFKTFQGQKILLFSGTNERVIREADVLIPSIGKISTKGGSREKILLDLSAIWQKNKNLIFKERLEKSLAEIAEAIKPSKEMFVLGNEPLVLFLFVYLRSQGVVENLYYQLNKNSLPNKVR